MANIKITNGIVYDPTQNLDGVKKDIYIKDGKIIDPKQNSLKNFDKTIDASGLIVMAGGIDIHSHIAGGNVNNARLLMPEVHKIFVENNLKNRKQLPGKGTRWTTEGTGYRYSEMGFTTVVEPAVLPVNSFVTHLELEKIPMIDKGGLAILGNDSFLLENLNKKKGQTFFDDYVAWTINSTKCLGLKVINAGGSEVFKQGGLDFSLDDVVPSYGITSRQILKTLNIANENLKIPHPLHVHCNNLGMAGNVETAINTIDAAEGRRMHLAHVQFYGYGNDGKRGFSSGSIKLSDKINKNNNISVDIGQVMFKKTVTISSDILRQFNARDYANPKKWIISEVEDGGGGIVPYIYKEKNFVNALQWIIGLELFLLIKDPWRVFLTTDHPNGAPFTSYPRLFRLLMEPDFRNSELKRINKFAFDVCHLKDIKRKYSLYEIAIMTRAAPAKLLGLKDRGSLKPGYIADISIYNPKKKIEKMFSEADYVFKNGQLIVKKGKIIKLIYGQTQGLDIHFDKSIKPNLKKWFEKFYSLELSSFQVDADFFREGNFNLH